MARSHTNLAKAGCSLTHHQGPAVQARRARACHRTNPRQQVSINAAPAPAHERGTTFGCRSKRVPSMHSAASFRQPMLQGYCDWPPETPPSKFATHAAPAKAQVDDRGELPPTNAVSGSCELGCPSKPSGRDQCFPEQNRLPGELPSGSIRVCSRTPSTDSGPQACILLMSMESTNHATMGGICWICALLIGTS